MVSEKVMVQRKKSIDLLDRSFAFKQDCVRFGNNETLKHAIAKFILCHQLHTEGKSFVTEARMNDKKSRADIFVLDSGEAWEVLQSETAEMFKQKVADYPVPAFCIKADDVLKGERL